MSAYREAYMSKLTNFWPNSSIQQYNLTNRGRHICSTYTGHRYYSNKPEEN